MPHWWFHFRNEIPINCLFTNWKCFYILDFRPWRWSALNMGFVVRRPSRMQGQQFVSNLGGAGKAIAFGWVQKFPWRVAPTRIWHPQKFVQGSLPSVGIVPYLHNTQALKGTYILYGIHEEALTLTSHAQLPSNLCWKCDLDFNICAEDLKFSRQIKLFRYFQANVEAHSSQSKFETLKFC